MNSTELEQKAIEELIEEVQRRLELETKGLASARFELTKLQIRVELFGEETLNEQERDAFAQRHPEDIVKHESGIAHLQKQLDKLRAYGQDGGQTKAAQGVGHPSHV